MEFISDIILEVNSNTAYTVVGAKQGDNDTRIVRAHLVQNGSPYAIESGAKATFRFRKPDGKAVINDAVIENNAQGIVTIGLTTQALAVAGRGYADIVLTKNREILSTVSFIIVIMSAPQVLSEIVSSNEFGYIEDIVSSARDTIYESEAWAKGTRAGIAVTSESNFDYDYGVGFSTEYYKEIKSRLDNNEQCKFVKMFFSDKIDASDFFIYAFTFDISFIAYIL